VHLAPDGKLGVLETGIIRNTRICSGNLRWFWKPTIE